MVKFPDYRRGGMQPSLAQVKPTRRELNVEEDVRFYWVSSHGEGMWQGTRTKDIKMR